MLASLVLLLAADRLPLPDERLIRPLDGTRWAQVTIRRRIVIRVPRMTFGTVSTLPRAPTTPLPPIRWVERRAPRCIPANTLAAAAFTRRNSVDLVLMGGRRVRARFGSDCPALDFYSGFYMRSTVDGQICADRDSVRSRSGGECRIQSFKLLLPDH